MDWEELAPSTSVSLARDSSHYPDQTSNLLCVTSADNVIKEYSLTLLYVVEEREEHARNLVAKCSQNQCTVVHPDDQSKVFNDDRSAIVTLMSTALALLDIITLNLSSYLSTCQAENTGDHVSLNFCQS